MITSTALAAALLKAREFELSAASLHALCILGAKGPQSMSAIAAEMETDTANTTGTADRLEALHFARRTRSLTDRRAVVLRFTEHGKAALGDILTEATRGSWQLSPAD